MKRCPTFEQLCEHRELAVVYPETGLRFRVSLRDWEGCLWAVRIYPDQMRPHDRDDPFVTAHRLLSRDTIEDWLGRLRLDRRRRQTGSTTLRSRV